MHYASVNSSDVMGAAEAAARVQQAELAKAAYDTAVSQHSIAEALRASKLDMATRRKDCIKYVFG
jgi:hypothetical protein